MSDKEEYAKIKAAPVYDDTDMGSAFNTEAPGRSYQTYNDGADVVAHPNEGEYSTSTKVPARLLAPFTYLFSWASALIVIIMERKSDYVLFHAWQSIVLFGVFYLPGYTIFWLIWPSSFIWVFNIFYIILCIFLMYRAYIDVNRMDGGFKLPCVGSIADRALDQCCTSRRLTQVL